MKMSNSTSGTIVAVLSTVIIIVLSSCSDKSDARSLSSQSDKLKVYAVNYPMQYLAQRIGGDLVDVKFPFPADVDPALWQPDVQIIGDYQKADMVLLNGATYAKWVKYVSLPSSKTIDTSAGFKDFYIEISGNATHTHGPKGEHEHGDIAFTTWIDFLQTVKHAEAIRDALVRLRPQNTETINANFNEIKGDLLALDKKMQDVAVTLKGQPLIVSHPVYQYWNRKYDLNTRSVHWEPDEFPDERMWKELESLLAEHPAKWMIWEGQPIEETVDKLKTAGVNSVVFDPCGNTPENSDFINVMKKNIENVSQLNRKN